jgi:hypothetical protein
MTTTFIDFVPTPAAPFQFRAVLDGESYTVIITWNLFGQRWYANLYTVDSVLLLSIGMVGSPLDVDISLTAGYTTTKLVWRPARGQFEVIDP